MLLVNVLWKKAGCIRMDLIVTAFAEVVSCHNHSQCQKSSNVISFLKVNSFLNKVRIIKNSLCCEFFLDANFTVVNRVKIGQISIRPSSHCFNVPCHTLTTYVQKTTKVKKIPRNLKISERGNISIVCKKHVFSSAYKSV